MSSPEILARLASANAACISRELAAMDSDFLRSVANIDRVAEASTQLAFIENLVGRRSLWEVHDWEEACALIALHLTQRPGEVSAFWLASFATRRSLPELPAQ